MHTTLVLGTPEFTNYFIMECGSLEHGFGVVWMQEGSPLPLKDANLKIK